MRKKTLKPVEATLLAAIQRIVARDQVPAFGVLMEETGILSSATLSRRLSLLEEKGHIHRVGNRIGSIVLLPDPLPLLAADIAEWIRTETGVSLSGRETAALADWLKGKL